MCSKTIWIREDSIKTIRMFRLIEEDLFAGDKSAVDSSEEPGGFSCLTGHYWHFY